MRADLHIHTTASDGCWTPERLLEESKKVGLEFLAVTDHDSVDNLALTAQLAKEEGLHFLPGVEISCTLEGELFHILGLGVDYRHAGLAELLASNRELMAQKDDESIKTLISRGYPLDYAHYQNYEYDPARGGWKALNFLIDQGICTGPGDFFSKLFAQEPVPFPVFPHPEKVMKVIKEAGGVAILAHPGGNLGGDLNKPNHQLAETLSHFLEIGIEGLECYHPSHTPAVIEACLNFCRKNRLLISGGSDCHGEIIPSRKLGQPFLTTNQLNLGYLMK